MNTVYPETSICKSKLINKPTVLLSQVEENLWEVLICDSMSSTWETLESALLEYKDSVLEYHFGIERQA